MGESVLSRYKNSPFAWFRNLTSVILLKWQDFIDSDKDHNIRVYRKGVALAPLFIPLFINPFFLISSNSPNLAASSSSFWGEEHYAFDHGLDILVFLELVEEEEVLFLL
jgi:hypothetical protein